MLTLNIELPTDITADEARLALALRLFEDHRVSAGKAADIAGYSKGTFLEIASKHGVSVLDYPAGTLEQEMAI
jgi:predicted HTH domain antitoxin